MSDEEDENITSDEPCSDHVETSVKREEKGRWSKGHSANPAGRPRGRRRINPDVLPIASQAQLAEYARRSARQQIERLEELAFNAKKENSSINAIGMLLDRGFGKPNQPLSNEQGLIENRADLGQLIEALRAELQNRKAQPALPAPLDATPDADGTFVVEVVPPTSEPER